MVRSGPTRFLLPAASGMQLRPHSASGMPLRSACLALQVGGELLSKSEVKSWYEKAPGSEWDSFLS